MPQPLRRFLLTATVALGVVSVFAPGALAARKPVNTALPVISGTAQAGQTLQVSTGSWTPTPASYAYTWYRCDSNGANCAPSPTSSSSASYSVTAGDVGSRIVAQVETDGFASNAVMSAPTAVVTAAPSAPVNLTRPVISGTAQVGQTLTVSNGTWSPAPTSYLYAWYRCDSNGANCLLSPTSSSSTSYVVTSGDVGYTLVAPVAPNGNWSASVNSAPTAVVTSAPSGTPVNLTRPVISGTAQVGQTLTVSNGTWSPTPTSYLYAWYRCDSNGANCALSPTSSSSTTYVLTSGDVGYRMVVPVAPNGNWNASVNSTPSATVTASTTTSTPVNVTRPVISGTAQVGQTLTVSNGTWSPTPTSYLYAWYRCDSNGANCLLSPTSSSSTSYVVTAGDVGYRMVVPVAPNGDWNASVNSTPSATVTASTTTSTTPVNVTRPAISGTAQVGQTLTVSNGTWSPTPTSYLYAWYRCDSNGANCALSPTSSNSQTYLVTSGDVGYTLVVPVAPNGNWSASVNSTPSAIVKAATTSSSSTGTVPGISLYRLGGSYGIGTNYNRYSYVITGRDDAARAALLPGKALVYMAGVDVSTSFSTGVDYSTALNNGWLLKDAAGNYMTGYGSYLGDVGSAAYQQAWVAGVSSLLTSSGADGVYIDDVLSNISTWSGCACFPAKYPSQTAWQNAMVSFMAYIGPALKAKGFYVLASAHAFIPGNLASNDGTLETAWWRQLAPYVSGLSTEYWTLNPANPSQIRSTGAQWYQQWDEWQKLVSVAQGAGIDFFGLTYGTASTPNIMRYAKGSFLLDWNGGGGAVMFEPTDGSDPWNLNWTTDVGFPSAAKVNIAPGVWQRQYSGGTVVVNSNGYAVTVTVNGVSRTIAATDAFIG